MSAKNVQFSDEEMINKMKKNGDADCFEQRWKEASPFLWILVNHDADEHKHFGTYRFLLSTKWA